MKKTKSKSLRALIVEDNVVNQMLIRVILSSVGYKCSIASNGLEAFMKVEKEEFNVIIMDVQMPVMDGYTSARKIRTLESKNGKNTVIVGLTAYAMKGDREKVLNAGMDYYISKPFKQEELLSVINGLEEGTQKKDLEREPFNISNFLEKFHHDRAFIQKMAENFSRTTDDYMSRIDNLLSEHDTHELLNATHKLKGSLSMMEAMEASKMISKLDKQIHSGEFIDARVTYTKLVREIYKVKEEIQKFLNLHST